MEKILACIDGSVYADSVADHAAWAGSKLGMPVELLRVLGRREASSDDRSGRIVAGARRKLLEELAELDGERAKLLRETARLDLEEACVRVEAVGVEAATMLRHGDLLEELAAREAEARIVVIGKRGDAADFAKLHLGSNLERLVRAATRPVLVTSRAYRPIKRVLIAFDGGPSVLKAVDAASRSPLLAGLDAVALTVGDETPAARAALDSAAAQLRAGLASVTTRFAKGKPDEVIAAAVDEERADLVLMGAYGHSRLRALMIGSTTSALIRACKVPLIVYR